MHPQAIVNDTHNVGNEHYHSDLCYGFVVTHRPRDTVHGDESSDLRWMTLSELEEGAKKGGVLKDAVYIYQYILRHIDDFVRVPATSFSLEYSTNGGVTYKRGIPGKNNAK